MMDPERFRHDRSLYERPDQPYQCGRARLWGKPCWQGSGLDGTCGGQSECAPARRGERWECRRPKYAGGPCPEGPFPDGTCAHRRPPCQPRPTLRKWRGRLSVFCAALTVTLIAAFGNFSPGPSLGMAAINPGPLSSLHDGFTREQGCVACHAMHEADGIAWLMSAFLEQDRSGKCLQCHGFKGPEKAAHNRAFPDRPEIGDVQCEACHTEHRGADFDPIEVEQVVCGNCHRDDIRSFQAGHPTFAEDFPCEVPNSIWFDHAKHMGEYFVDDRYLSQASRDAEFAALAKTSCTACHAVESATREVTPRPYEAICGRCHDDQILDRPLVLYSPAWITSLSGVVLGATDSDDDAEEVAAAFREELTERSIDAIGERLSALGEEADPRVLLTGLSAVALQQAASAWVEDEDYEPEIEPELALGGWRVGYDPNGEQTVHYLPTRHADPVLRAWFELVREQAEAPDEEAAERARLALEELLDPDLGAGACGKCHSAGITGANEANAPAWRFRGSVARPHTRFSHAPHISLLGPDVSCKTCHILNTEADYAAFFQDWEAPPEAFESNFHAISKSTCDRCHTQGVVRHDCQLCHTYHREAGFKVTFRRPRAEK